MRWNWKKWLGLGLLGMAVLGIGLIIWQLDLPNWQALDLDRIRSRPTSTSLYDAEGNELGPLGSRQERVYAELDETYRYRGPVDVQETAFRYTPVVLLDAALYGSITSETTGSGTLLTFSEPTAPETWSVPPEAELVEASGSALVSAEGTLEELRNDFYNHYDMSRNF